MKSFENEHCEYLNMAEDLNTNPNVENLDNLVSVDSEQSTKEAEKGCSNHTYWYRHPRSRQEYKICADRDGFLVTKPGGGTDAWGTGYTWRDVEQGYGLGGYYKKREYHCDSC